MAHLLIVTVVLARDVQIQLRERVAGDRLAALPHLVHPQLELGELRLTEHGGLDAFEVVAEQRQPRRRVLDPLQHVVDEQRLVER